MAFWRPARYYRFRLALESRAMLRKLKTCSNTWIGTDSLQSRSFSNSVAFILASMHLLRLQHDLRLDFPFDLAVAKVSISLVLALAKPTSLDRVPVSQSYWPMKLREVPLMTATIYAERAFGEITVKIVMMTLMSTKTPSIT
jgi:hypothetical protein